MSKSLKKLIDINRLREFKNKLVVGAGSAYVQTGAVDQTVAGTKTFSKPIVGSVTGSSGSCTGNAATATTATTAKACTGNAATATKLQTARTINGTSFNGTANITTANWGTARDITIADSTGDNTGEAVSVNGSAAVTLKLPATIKASLDGNAATATSATTAASATTATTAKVCTGNAATATKLAAKRTIALSGAATGTATGFDGSGNITIPVTSLDASKLTGTASVSTTGNAATATTATTATNATYTNWLRTSSHSDHLFHTEWDKAGYFWTYVTAGNGDYRAVRVARSDSSGKADTATKATQDSDGNKITTTYSKNGHTHDDRYYTEAEVNNLLAGKANSSHTHPYIPTSASCNKNWHWQGQGGQPSWLWGGEDGTNMYVYNPSNFSVNYANSAGSCTGNSATATTAGAVSTSVAAGSTKDLVYAFMADSDAFRIRCGGGGDNGYVEIATSDNGNEPIYVRQYDGEVGSFGSVARTLTLLDGNGNTQFPGTVSASTFSGNLTGNCSGSSGSCTGNAATATNATYANWLRTSSHSDHLFHTEWDGAYFWTYVTTGSGEYRAVRVARSDSSGNADTATKLATARTIALSGAATGTATGFDGSGNITIPVTALASSAIRAQWYAAYPDGAEAHNAMWGGRDITAAFNNGTVSANIANGTFRDIFPGDYITKAVTIYGNGTPGMTYTVNWVIADCDYWINKGDTATTTHHVAIVPQQPIFNANMNATNTTEGGYKGSVMYRSIIRASVTGGIVSAFGSDHILTFRDNISNSVDTSHVSSGIPQYMGTPDWGGEWVSVQCNLMSEKMVYGAPICAAGAMDNVMATRQMSAFRLSEKLINYNRNWWWLRDVVSSAFFAFVRGDGFADTGIASYVRGVRPFALLK